MESHDSISWQPVMVRSCFDVIRVKLSHWRRKKGIIVYTKFCNKMYNSLRASILRRRKLKWVLQQARRWVFAFTERLLRFWRIVRWCAPNMANSDSDLAPFPHPHPDGGLPIAFPLTTLEELKERRYLSCPNLEFLKSSVPLKDGYSGHVKRSQLLVCHDYKGGYQEDKWVQGKLGMEGYHLWHWHLIDVFVYFSHSLVTVPPPGWINAAHKHGVRVLGTFITEWDHGASVCRALLTDGETSCLFASRLAELADVLGFDGWLINIENRVDEKDMPRLHLFVQHLRHCMHALIPNSIVIWYDAVTEEGKLDWQNCLNEKNWFFFVDSDGLFTNYTWKEEMAKSSAIAAGVRAADVYMGVDVFGRNTFGGGGFQCDVALKASRKADVSAALFAPAWVLESNQPPSFEIAQTRWWGTIERCWPVTRFNPTTLPFFSDFNRGCGSLVSVEGEEVSNQPWFNLSCQSLQPLLHVMSNSQMEHSLVQTSISHEAAYSGGSCLKIFGSDGIGVVQLYEAHVPVAGSPIHISHSVLLETRLQVCLVLRMSRDNSWFLVLLVGDNEDIHIPLSSQRFVVKYPTPNDIVLQASKNKWSIRTHMLEFGTCILNQIYAVTYSQNLNGDCLLSIIEGNVHVNNSKVTGDDLDGMATAGDDAASSCALLGHVRIATSAQHDSTLPGILFEGCHLDMDGVTGGQRSVSLTLRWGLDIRGGIQQGLCRWVQYHVYITKQDQMELRGDNSESGLRSTLEFLGIAVVQAFSVNKLLVDTSCQKLVFSVRPQCVCGVWGQPTESPINIPAVFSKHWVPTSDPSQPLLSMTENNV